jgi:hypothetical protein
MQDWISFHYSGKKGIVHTEFPEIGDLLVNELGAIYLETIETPIGTYKRYSVRNLMEAYYIMFSGFRYILGW